MFIAATLTGLNWKVNKVTCSTGESDDPSVNALRLNILSIAVGQLGSSDWRKYQADAAKWTNGQRVEWCGVFTLWVLHQVGLYTGWQFEMSKGYLYRLPLTSNPLPGDIAYFTSKSHHAIVYDIQGDTLYTVDGNDGGGEGHVGFNQRTVASEIVYYRIG
jgi:hypothetical protein